MNRFLSSAAAAGLLLLLTACSGAGSDTTSTSTSDATTSGTSTAAVSFTHPVLEDVTIELEAAPEVIVADYYAAGALADYGITPDAVFGYGYDDPWGKGNAQLDGVEVLGQGGEINLEKLAELNPDIIVGHGNATGWSWFQEDVNAQVQQVAPFLPLSYTGTIEENFAQAREVASFLGGDTTSATITQADADFAAAKEELADALAGKNLSIMLMSPDKEMVYSALGFSAEELFTEAGATVVGAPRPETGNPWGRISWEELADYNVDAFAVESTLGDLEDIDFELWRSQPAVEQGQVFRWNSKMAYSPVVYTTWLREITPQIAAMTALN